MLLVVLFLVVLRLLTGLSPVEQVLHTITSPLSAAIEEISFDQNEESLNQNIKAENRELEKQNSELKNQLQISSEFVVAEVTRKDVISFRKLFILNKGSDDGLKKGQAVLSDGFLIGKVTRTTRSTSVAQLVNDPEFKATASTETDQGGVVKTENGSLLFDLAPEDDLTGQMVSTDGLDNQFTPGLPIGVLGDRVTSKDSAFHKYHLILPRPMTSINLVNIEVKN